MRSLISALILALGFALVGPATPAFAQGENCFFLISWSSRGAACGPGKQLMTQSARQVRECVTGAARTHDVGPPTGCRIAYQNAEGYVDRSAQCEPVLTETGIEVANGCGGDLSPPVLCAALNDARKDKSACVGDPVDLRTGALSIDPCPGT